MPADRTVGGRQDEDALLRGAMPALEHAEGALVPHPERVSESYADERVRDKIEMYEDDRPREGLTNVDRDLKRAGVPPAWRLHYITAVAHLGRVGARTLESRRERADRKMDTPAGP